MQSAWLRLRRWDGQIPPRLHLPPCTTQTNHDRCDAGSGMQQTTSEHKMREYVYSRLAAHLVHAAGWNPSRGLNPCPIIDRTFTGCTAPHNADAGHQLGGLAMVSPISTTPPQKLAPLTEVAPHIYKCERTGCGEPPHPAAAIFEPPPQKLAPLTGMAPHIFTCEGTGCGDPPHPAVVIFLCRTCSRRLTYTRQGSGTNMVRKMKPEVLLRHQK